MPRLNERVRPARRDFRRCQEARADRRSRRMGEPPGAEWRSRGWPGHERARPGPSGRPGLLRRTIRVTPGAAAVRGSTRGRRFPTTAPFGLGARIASRGTTSSPTLTLAARFQEPPGDNFIAKRGCTSQKPAPRPSRCDVAPSQATVRFRQASNPIFRIVRMAILQRNPALSAVIAP